MITGKIIFYQVGKAEFLGRATGKPHVYLEEEVSFSISGGVKNIMLKVDYCPPRLEWFQIYRGNEEAGKV